MRGTIWETQISSPNFQKLMLVESPVVSVVTSGLPIASIQHATDNHCENHISTHWHQHLPTRFSKKFHLVEINFHNDIRSLVSSEICCKRGYSVWLRVQTFPVGNHWCMNLKVLWITSENNNWKLKGLHWIQVIFFLFFFLLQDSEENLSNFFIIWDAGFPVEHSVELCLWNAIFFFFFKDI